jgi:hypothetical protein
MSLRRVLLLTGLALFAAALVRAHVRLVHPTTKAPLYWSSPSSVGIVVGEAGSDDLPDGSHTTALRNAIDEWNSIEGTTLRLVEDASEEARARTDWSSHSIHLVLFDEDNDSGYFPPGSSTVAITPVWFYSNGRIADADVLFNGGGFRFTTSGEPGRYDVQDVAVHELGHLLGLDHTGWAGGSMFPYVDTTVILHRSLSLDERTAARLIYPTAGVTSVSGRVLRATGGATVAGAHVVLRGVDGRTAAAALTAEDGTFRVGGMDPGTYTLLVTPLDFPVSSANLGSGWVVESDFEATLHGLVVAADGLDTAAGDVLVGDDVLLSLGRSSDDYPLRVEAGRTTSVAIRGAGLTAGSTLSCSDPTVGVAVTGWFTSQVNAQITVPAGAAPGHCDLTVVNAAGDRSILVAGLEVTPPDPAVVLVTPSQGDFGGGTPLTIAGSDFRAGARVVIGGEVYVDGAPGGCTVVNQGTITLTTRESVIGTSDVVVIDPSGVEGRLGNAFQFLAVPEIEASFPPAGSAAGGTELRITGANFDAGSTVRINGVVQGSVFPVSDQLLVVITEPGLVGGPYTVEVRNPGGAAATTQFSYAAQADPDLVAVAPGQASSGGGETLTLTGADFGADLEVRFGVDPSTGTGGRVAAALTRVDAGTLEVVTPSLAAGLTSVLVRDLTTGQADLLTNSLSVQAPPSGGGGGGGCSTVPVQGPPDPRDLLGFGLLAAVLALGARRSHRGVRPSGARRAASEAAA